MICYFITAERTQFVKKEHYIPQFSMRPFEIAKGFCLTVNLEADTLEAKEKKTGNYYNNSKISK